MGRTKCWQKSDDLSLTLIFIHAIMEIFILIYFIIKYYLIVNRVSLWPFRDVH